MIVRRSAYQRAVRFMQDNSKVGIQATLSNLSRLLQEKDHVLWHHLTIENKARPPRRLSTQMPQRMNFPSLLGLYDGDVA